MIIGIIPKIVEKYENQLEISVELNLLNFLNKVFNNPKIEILSKKNNINFDLLIISGGNDLPNLKRNKANKYRNNLNNFFFSKAFKENLPVIGICLGAQFIAKKYRCKFKKKNHVGSHKIIYQNKKIKVNSYHNYVITKFSKDIKPLALADDNTLEYFEIKNKRITGIIWHPERNKKIREDAQKFKASYLRSNQI